ncbi:MAG TPA: STAS domain-containing protein [Umezawaea sp.]|nr:STAS domain-containing protein [Umezawaea sp.]
MSEAPDAAVITTGSRWGASVLRCSGEVDMTSAASLRSAISTVLASRPRALVIDLVDVAFFGSAGISALIAAQEQADRAGVPLAVAASGRPVLRPLEITTVDLFLALHPSVDEAVTATVQPRTVTQEGAEGVR